MPTYEYECPKCGHQFEAFMRKIIDKSTKKCPECGGRAQRLISGGAGLLFKGSGFYITDYKKKGRERKDDSGSDSASGEKGSKETKDTGTTDKSE